MTATPSSGNRSGLIVLAIIIIAIAAYYFLTLPDNRSTSEKVGDAIHDLDKGPDKAARQLEDRTPGQKLGDKLKDATAPNSQ